MTGRWNIDPLGVQTVLTRVGTHAADVGAAAQSFASDLQIAASASGSRVVATALSDFVTARGPELTSAADLIASAEKGVVAAVVAYARGDLEMAANVQSGVVHPPDPNRRYHLAGGSRTASL